ncbi:MAG: penicillin-binding protein 2 [Actinobacteria bacterium]|nr:penicillin-binding protein 2 [Actinomycetota bacterium]
MNSDIRRRIRIILYLVLLLMVVLVLRLYYLQVISGNIYAGIASQSIARPKTIPAPRGNIYDRNGKLLVESVPVSAVGVNPHIVLGNEEVLRLLSQKLDIPYNELVERLKKSNVSYIERVILKKNIDPETITYLKENSQGLPGVEVIDIFLRKYNYGFLAAHILGYVGEIDEEKLKMDEYKVGYEGGDQIGWTGVEKTYEKILKGVKGEIVYEVDPVGRPVGILKQEDYIPGDDLYLTIDIDLQRAVEEILSQSLAEIRKNKVPRSDEYYRAGGGAVVVLDAQNGEVLAMASYPTYDPSLFVGGIKVSDWEYLNNPENNNPLINRAIMGGFVPGSSFKLVTAYAGLSEGIIDRDRRITCSGVWYGLGKSFPKWCWRQGGHGSISILKAIEQSCDIYFYEVGLELFLRNNNKDELLQKYARLFGFGAETGIDLPDEGKGVVPDKKWKEDFFASQPGSSVWYPGDTVNMAIGQGDLLVTPLQMAQAYSILANRGIKYTPHVVKGISEESGRLFIDLNNQAYEDLFLNEDFVNTIEEGLKLVTKQGTASGAFSKFPLNEISVAGKTGTAEIVGKQDYAWFVSYAPVENPKYVICVMLEEAGGGGASAAPVAEKIYEYIFNVVK